MSYLSKKHTSAHHKIRGSVEELILVHVYYDKNLSAFSGTEEENVQVPKGITSADFIKYILQRHPKMARQFKKGKLTFEHESISPKAKDILKNNDVYIISTWTMKEMRESLQGMLQFALDYFSIPKTKDEVLTHIFFQEGEQDRLELLRYFISFVYEPDLIKIVYGLINQVWLFFPHHSLNGKSPIETYQKVVRDRLK